MQRRALTPVCRLTAQPRRERVHQPEREHGLASKTRRCHGYGLVVAQPVQRQHRLKQATLLAEARARGGNYPKTAFATTRRRIPAARSLRAKSERTGNVGGGE